MHSGSRSLVSLEGRGMRADEMRRALVTLDTDCILPSHRPTVRRLVATALQTNHSFSDSVLFYVAFLTVTP